MTIIVGTRGREFANKNCPQGQAFGQFFQVPWACLGGWGMGGGGGGGMLVAGIDTHITVQFETEGNGQNEIVSRRDRSEVKL